MNTPVIEVESISKKYLIAHRRESSHLGVRDLLASKARALGGLFFGNRAKATSREEFWALDGITFSVKQGEVVGVLGSNGAGKSTLLKILSRITEPTGGRIVLRGRVGSLLEVGTGFHPELTGRENIFLNGAILGMRRLDIKQRFDEIVAFSEIERFLDTPIKHYSSGMYTRLAFAVAAHLEPDILLVDEVLAVGDAAFQRKCLGKMKAISHEGRTILFVSHNVGAVAALCQRALLLHDGKLLSDGPAAEVAATYQARSLTPVAADHDLSNAVRRGNAKARFTFLKVSAVTATGELSSVATTGCDLVIDVTATASAAIDHANLAAFIADATGYRLIDADTGMKQDFVSLGPGETVRARFEVRNVLLKPGVYFVGLWLGRVGVEEDKDIDYIEHAATCQFAQNPALTQHTVVFPGVYRCDFDYTVEVLR